MPHVNEMHAHHDHVLVVSLASGDLAAADRDRATALSLVETCADCARLHDDVLAIAQATKALPAATRSRDFRISPEQAAKLRPAGWRGFLAGLTAPGQVFSRQLGVGLTTLGIAGLLISSLPAMSFGMGGSAAGASAAPAGAPALESTSRGENLQAAPAPSAAASAITPDHVTTLAPAATAPTQFDTAASSQPYRASSEGAGLNVGSAAPVFSAASNPPPKAAASPPSALLDREVLVAGGSDDTGGGPSGLAVASGAFLVAGVLLLVGRAIARRATAA